MLEHFIEQQTTKKKYYPHLDGLRAIALFGVLLFHFKVHPFSGGFVGVDIFLALSGFLITNNIIQDDNFSLRHFFVRRFYRLYPAAVTTSLITLMCAFLTFSSELALSTSEAALSSMSLASNLYFWLKDNYFDSSADLKPLLHTWSLSLEEQFYMIWAPMIVILAPHYAVSLVVLTITSLSLAFVLHFHNPSFVFFQLPTRLFQFAAGALIAIVKPFEFFSENSLILDCLVFISLTGIFLCFACMPESSPPLLMAVVSFLSSILISIPYGFISSTVLSSRILSHLGKLSYSAYLVHWPLYSFSKHVCDAMQCSQLHPTILLAGTFTLALILHNAIETPMRRGRRRVIFWMIVLATLGMGLYGKYTKGFFFREAHLFMAYDNSDILTHELLRTYCHDEDVREAIPWHHENDKGCRVGDLEGTESNFVFIGDSFTSHLGPGLEIVGKKRKEYYRMLFQTSCAFLPEEMGKNLKYGKDPCHTQHYRRWEAVKTMEKNRTIVVGNRWWWTAPELQAHLLRKLALEIRALGHDIIYAIEPPGVHQKDSGLYSCTSMMLLPIGRVWQTLHGKEYRGARRCVNLSIGVRPALGRIWEAQGFYNISAQMNISLIDPFSELCGDRFSELNISKNDDEIRCLLPIEDAQGLGIVYDIGYTVDRVHYTVLGSRAMSSLLEKNLLMYESRMKTPR